VLARDFVGNQRGATGQFPLAVADKPAPRSAHRGVAHDKAIARENADGFSLEACQARRYFTHRLHCLKPIAFKLQVGRDTVQPAEENATFHEPLQNRHREFTVADNPGFEHHRTIR